MLDFVVAAVHAQAFCRHGVEAVDGVVVETVHTARFQAGAPGGCVTHFGGSGSASGVTGKTFGGVDLLAGARLASGGAGDHGGGACVTGHAHLTHMLGTVSGGFSGCAYAQGKTRKSGGKSDGFDSK